MPRRDDDGLTLIELLISMAVLLIIMAPLATAFVVGLGTTRATEQDAGNSADAQLLASFLDVDVASAETLSTTTTCGGGGGLLQLRWIDGTAPQVVAYRAVANASRQARLQLTTAVYDLKRDQCTTDNTPSSSQVIARTLSGVPLVTCDGSGSCNATPRRVTLRATAYSTQISDVGSSSTYTFGVTASRRVRP